MIIEYNSGKTGEQLRRYLMPNIAKTYVVTKATPIRHAMHVPLIYPYGDEPDVPYKTCNEFGLSQSSNNPLFSFIFENIDDREDCKELCKELGGVVENPTTHELSFTDNVKSKVICSICIIYEFPKNSPNAKLYLTPKRGNTFLGYTKGLITDVSHYYTQDAYQMHVLPFSKFDPDYGSVTDADRLATIPTLGGVMPPSGLRVERLLPEDTRKRV